jgi:predicted methyltransferase
MPHVTELAHRVLRPAIGLGAWAVDTTVGNGYDTEFLSVCVGPHGRVFGFDVQAQALAATAARVRNAPNVTLFHDGHEHFSARLPAEAKGRLAAIMFNLGYLPGAEKSVTTQTSTTLQALQQALDYLAIGGVVTLALYPGHPAGRIEAGAVHEYAQRLPPVFAATLVDRLNATNTAPQLVIIERLR